VQKKQSKIGPRWATEQQQIDKKNVKKSSQNGAKINRKSMKN